ncbi:MAG: hydroxysqualene dehydroxylase HpnE [Bacteroidetes bacterium]|nr:hydroxysqualene dehydroxylase HpnE [Bacteroidota bacterium]MCW5896425.1 hydroxysqualene dehydroxylase HpnE [Bacteroidota bacterium]
MHSPSLDSKPVVIVGGGLSGLAAAVELSSRNIPVVVLEQKPKLGGRAYSFVDETTGDVIDNGQHVLIAGYERTMRFLERIGTKHLLTIQNQPLLHFHHPRRGFCSFRIPDLPSPFHLLAGILSTDLFSWRDRLKLLRAGISLRTSDNDFSLDTMTIEEWLDDTGQTDETKRSFWEPLAISIMNEHIAKASARVFIDSLRHAFLAERKNSAIAIPQVGLSELYVDDAVRFIRERGGEIRVIADVLQLEACDSRISHVKTRSGADVECSAVILSVPHYRLPDLMPPQLQPTNLTSFASVPNTPIVSIHLWFAIDFMPYDMLGLIGRRVQWVFNKRTINEEKGEGGHVSCVISAGDEFTGMSSDELVRIAVEDLQSVYPSVPLAPSHGVVIREKRATFSCTPESEKLRPNHQTGIANLFLAGDWTNTGLPATIEGAILSGERCAAFAAEVSQLKEFHL